MVSRLSLAAVWLVLSAALVLGGVVALADTGAEGDARADRINTTQVARVVHAEVNAERRARGLPAYERRPGATAAAANHAGWLADAGRLKHQPDRYTCGPGANIAYTYANRDVKTGWGEVANHHNNETAIGQYLVKQWLHSPPHREHLLSERYTGHGVGVAVGEVNGSVRVYAAEAFCT